MGQNIHPPRVFISANEDKQSEGYTVSGNLSNSNGNTPTNLHNHGIFDDTHGLSPPHNQTPYLIVGGSSSSSSGGGGGVDDIVSSPFHSPRSPKFTRNHDDILFDNSSDSFSTSPQNSPKLTSRTKRMSSGPNHASPKIESFRKQQQQHQPKQTTVWFSSVSNESDWMVHSNRFSHSKKQKMVLMLSYGVNTHSEDLFQYWFQRFLPKSEESQTKVKIMQLCALYLRRLCFAYVNRNCPTQIVHESSTSTSSNQDEMVDYSKTLKRFDSWTLSPVTREETFSHDDFINELIDMLVNNDESFILQSLGHWNLNILKNMELLWKSEAIQHAASILVEQQVYMDEKQYAEYFLNAIPQLLDSSYNLTVSDLSNAQKRKFKINEIKIVDQSNYDCLYSVLDISSMGGEKTKWLRSFNNVDGFLMIFSLDEIAQDKSSLQKALHSFREMTSYFFGNNQQNGCKTQIYVCFSNVIEFCKMVKSEDLALQLSLKGDVTNPSIVFKYIVSQFMTNNGSCSNNLTERSPTSSQNISFYALDSFSDYYSMHEFTSHLLEGKNYFSELITGTKEKRDALKRSELFAMCKLNNNLTRYLTDISFTFEQ